MQTAIDTSSVNYTSNLIAERGQPLLDLINRVLASKLRLSRDMGLIEQHSQEYLCYVIERDAWAKRIQSGDIPTNSQIASWAYRRALNEIRGWGTDAAMVELRAAKTERTRQIQEDDNQNWSPKVKAERYIPSKSSRHRPGVTLSMLQYWKQPYGSSSGALKSGDTPVIDGLRSENGDEDAIDMIAFAQVMDKLEDVVRKNIRSPRYVGVLKQLVNEELTVSEIAQNEGVSRNRAASILADLRKCLREARKRGDLDGII